MGKINLIKNINRKGFELFEALNEYSNNKIYHKMLYLEKGSEPSIIPAWEKITN